tara:strand:+ start:269 stop:487 length:219 start_codon:yes stop_codon:yes gene_type:complete
MEKPLSNGKTQTLPVDSSVSKVLGHQSVKKENKATSVSPIKISLNRQSIYVNLNPNQINQHKTTNSTSVFFG